MKGSLPGTLFSIVLIDSHGCKPMGDRPNIEIDGVEFSSPFHAFMHECMRRKNLVGKDASVVQRELSDCANAWEEQVNQRVPDDVDEAQLAEQILTGQLGRPTGEQ